MRNGQRILALGVFTTFGLAMAGGFFAGYPAKDASSSAPPPLLPAAHAAPAEIAEQDTLHSGETISELLDRAHLAEDDATSLLAALREHQDPRRLRPGSVISYRRSAESGAVRGMDIKLDADRSLSVEREGGEWKGKVEEVPLHTDSVVLTGTVKSSLYAALVSGEGADVPSDERERIADILADRIFAWQVDFSRDLRAGDEYRILYERSVRPDGTARTGRVLAVQFQINHRDYQAYLFRTPDGVESYYQRDGGSLKRAFLRAPLAFRRISSVFTNSRYHPLLHTSRPHYGIDYAASSGTPVHAVGDAVVVSAGWSNGYGNLVELRHKNGYTTRYGHMRAFAKGIRRGVRVQQGDVIGYVGMTGLATGPHLHYEFRINGKPVDPKGVKFITGDPVPGGSRSAFRTMVRVQTLAMDRASEPVLLADAGTASQKNGDD
jgi:murein DD-endopeptidase MepM/ murein hydrolase activator NlpD